MTRGLQAAGDGLASEDKAKAAKGLQSLSQALKLAARRGKGLANSLGASDRELSKALEDLRRKKKAAALGKGGSPGAGKGQGKGQGKGGDGASPGGKGGKGGQGKNGKQGQGSAAGQGSGKGPGKGGQQASGKTGQSGTQQHTGPSQGKTLTPKEALERRRLAAKNRKNGKVRPAQDGAKGGRGRSVGDGEGDATREGGAGGGAPALRGAMPQVAVQAVETDPEVVYQRQVGEYLARENLPLEYREMVRQYFKN